jgi:drug/metabolite transporter (DMT)-like permease
MLMHYLSIGIVLLAGIGYHMTSRNIPQGGNNFLGTSIAYTMATLVCMFVFLLTKDGGIAWEMEQISWRYLLIGFMIPGVEIGFVTMYQHGWEISRGALTANVLVSGLLLIIGLVVFHDSLTWVNLLGIAVCFAGVILIER